MVIAAPWPAFTQGIITTVAGTGLSGFSGDGGPATSAAFRLPDGLALDQEGNLYIADWLNNRIRKVDRAGTIITIAGNGGDGFSGDSGPAASASLAGPRSVAIDFMGNIFFAEWAGHRVRKVTPAGTISTVAGNGFAVFSGDGGPATAAGIHRPRGLAIDALGNLYIADINNNRIRKVTPSGTISTVAGNGQGGFAGDGGPATSAQLLYPGAVAVDQAGNLFIAESFYYTYEGGPPAPGNHRIRKVSLDGIITTVAGNGEKGFSGDGGPAIEARLCYPEGIAVDVAGNLYITDSGNHRIRQVDLSGTIRTVAGGGHTDPEGEFSGDGGLATRAALDLATKDYVKSAGSAVTDGSGNLYIADIENGRIRKVTSTSGPVLSGNSVVNAASFSFSGAATPGSLVSIFGHFLGSDVQAALSVPLPLSLGSSSLTIGGMALPLLYGSPEQINAQVPWEAPLGTASIEARTANGVATSALTVIPFSPGIFVIASGSEDGSQGAILTATGELAAVSGSIPGWSARPAQRGEFISIYATGIGDVNNRPASGAAASSSPLSETMLTPAVQIGGAPAPSVTFSGLAPGYVGLYQVNVRVPAEAPTDNAVPVVLQIDGVHSNTATIAVQ